MPSVREANRRGQQPRLLAHVRNAIRARHYRIRPEEVYVQWSRRFIRFHDKRHPQEMGATGVQQVLTDLALTQRVAAAAQHQALRALLFLSKVVLQQDIGAMENVIRAKQPKQLPVVLRRAEGKAVLPHVSGPTWLMASLLYGAGLQLRECLRLRIRAVDFAYHQITVRAGKGAKDRVTMLPSNVKEPLQQHLEAVKRLHE
jgi:integrase